MTAFDDAATVLFADPNLGMDATYTPQVGDIATVRVIIERDTFRMPPGLDGYAVEPRTEISVIKATLAQLPAHGDQITIGSETWRVEERIQDDGLVIRLAVFLL